MFVEIQKRMQFVVFGECSYVWGVSEGGVGDSWRASRWSYLRTLKWVAIEGFYESQLRQNIHCVPTPLIL